MGAHCKEPNNGAQKSVAAAAAAAAAAGNYKRCSCKNEGRGLTVTELGCQHLPLDLFNLVQLAAAGWARQRDSRNALNERQSHRTKGHTSQPPECSWTRRQTGKCGANANSSHNRVCSDDPHEVELQARMPLRSAGRDQARVRPPLSPGMHDIAVSGQRLSASNMLRRLTKFQAN